MNLFQAFKNPTAKENWTQYWDDGSNCHYYFNKVTQETAWEEPSGGFLTNDGDGATDHDEDNPNQEWAGKSSKKRWSNAVIILFLFVFSVITAFQQTQTV